MSAAAFRAFIRLAGGDDDFAALVAVVRRDPVPPPDLSGNAPVVNVLEPVQIGLVKSIGHEAQLALFNRLDGRPGQFVHADEPLFLDHRLDRRLAAVMRADSVLMLLDLDEIAARLEVLDDLLSRLVAVHAGIPSAVLVDRRVVI